MMSGDESHQDGAFSSSSCSLVRPVVEHVVDKIVDSLSHRTALHAQMGSDILALKEKSSDPQLVEKNCELAEQVAQSCEDIKENWQSLTAQFRRLDALASLTARIHSDLAQCEAAAEALEARLANQEPGTSLNSLLIQGIKKFDATEAEEVALLSPADVFRPEDFLPSLPQPGKL